MRIHITLDEGLVSEIDRRVGVGRRSAYVAQAVKSAIDNERRWELIESAVGAIADDPDRPWGPDAAQWVHAERRGDARRVG